jgi:hypothetical protein
MAGRGAMGALIFSLLMGCQTDPKTAGDTAIPIGEGTFIYKRIVYKLLNNELLQISDLDSPHIRKLEISKPALKYLGEASIDFVKKGASGNISSVYRGNYLYFRLRLHGINDLKDNFYPGNFTIEFLDEFGFVINSIDVQTSELIREVGDDGTTDSYEYNGKMELSKEAETAISSCSITSSVKPKIVR